MLVIVLGNCSVYFGRSYVHQYSCSIHVGKKDLKPCMGLKLNEIENVKFLAVLVVNQLRANQLLQVYSGETK